MVVESAASQLGEEEVEEVVVVAFAGHTRPDDVGRRPAIVIVTVIVIVIVTPLTAVPTVLPVTRCRRRTPPVLPLPLPLSHRR